VVDDATQVLKPHFGHQEGYISMRHFARRPEASLLTSRHYYNCLRDMADNRGKIGSTFGLDIVLKVLWKVLGHAGR
jgi:hypothetical protein